MARIRTVKPELFRHEALYEAEKKHKLPLRFSFIGLFTSCDREGRFKWRPRELKLDVLPHDEIDFNLILDALLKEGFIVKYEINGNIYGYIPSWIKHQMINNKEKQSEIPAPLFNNASTTCESRVNDASATPLLLVQGEGKGKEEKGKEEKGKEEKGKEEKGKEDLCKVSDETFLPSLHENHVYSQAETSIQKKCDTEVSKIFHHWQNVMNHPKAKLDDKRRKVILSGIKKYSVENLKQAIDGCANISFNMGKNKEQQRYDSIELIFRDAEHIERFMNNAPGNKQEIMTQQNDVFAGAD